jgi:riboflavin synthase
MFTGIVEIIGSEFLSFRLHIFSKLALAVSKLEELDTSTSGGGGTSLTISDAKDILGDCHEGDSIAVNGKE